MSYILWVIMKVKNSTIVSISVLIAAPSTSYYFVICLPKAAELKLKQEESIKTRERVNEYLRQSSLDKCLGEADAAYTNNWNSACSDLGLENLCKLPSRTATQFEENKKTNKDICFQRYK
jgi:hypothetical protein